MIKLQDLEKLYALHLKRSCIYDAAVYHILKIDLGYYNKKNQLEYNFYTYNCRRSLKFNFE